MGDACNACAGTDAGWFFQQQVGWHGQRVVRRADPLQPHLHGLKDVFAVEAASMSVRHSSHARAHRTVVALAPLMASRSCSEVGCVH